MARKKESAPWDAPPARMRVVRGPDETSPLYYWRATVREDGKERQVWAGRSARLCPVTQAEVLAAVEERRKASAPQALDVRRLLGTWKGAQRDRREQGAITESTENVYALRVRHLSSGLGAVLLESLDREVIGRYQRDRLASGAAPSVVTAEVLVLSFAWTWGRSVGLAPDRDLAIPDPPKPRRVADDYTPTHAEVLRVIEATISPWHRLALVLLYATGARVSEITDRIREDIDLEHGTIRLEGKTGPREVPLSDDALRELRRYPLPDSGRIFEPDSDDAIRAALVKTCRRAGLRQRFTPQGLRRLACDTLYETEDPGTAAAMLGHSPTVAIQHYRRVKPDRLRAALKRSGLGRIPEGKVHALASRATVSGPDDPDDKQ